MKFKIKQLVEKEVNVKYVRIVWEERYDDENIPYSFPCRNGDIVDMLIDIDTGKIIDFPDDWYGDCSTKLCDDGRYYLLNEKMEVVLKLDDGDYVPNKLIPERDGCGNCINLKIACGHITNWYKEPSIDNFVKQYKEDEDF